MKSRYIIFIFFFTAFSGSVKAQKISYGVKQKIDNVKYTCFYDLKYREDSTDLEKVRSAKMILLVGSNTSEFLEQNLYLKDSVCLGFKGEDPYVLLSQMLGLPKAHLMYKIYKNYPTGKITHAKKYVKGYLYEEPMDLFSWKIENQTDTVAGYVCQKATTSFGGRNYEAWFTTEIPINDGPYKFQGLPGFITKVQDTKKHYIFTFKYLEKNNDPERIIFIEDKYNRKVSRKAYKNLERRFLEDPEGVKAEHGLTVISSEESRQKKLKYLRNKNNIIELE